MKRLKYLKLRNIMGLGIDDGEIEFHFGKKNIVTGSNGAGKTRLLKVISTLFADRVKTDWLRTDNQGEGEIVALFEDNSKAKFTYELEFTNEEGYKDNLGLVQKELNNKPDKIYKPKKKDKNSNFVEVT